MLAMYLKLKYGDFLLIDIVYENGPITFFCISAVFMLDVSIDTGLRTFLHLISICKYNIFVVFDVFDRKGIFHPVNPTNVGSNNHLQYATEKSQNKRYNYY
jgi:hypothetical protein